MWVMNLAKFEPTYSFKSLQLSLHVMQYTSDEVLALGTVHFGDPGRAVDPGWLFLTITFELNGFWPTNLARWFTFTISVSDSKAEYYGNWCDYKWGLSSTTLCLHHAFYGLLEALCFQSARLSVYAWLQCCHSLASLLLTHSLILLLTNK